MVQDLFRGRQTNSGMERGKTSMNVAYLGPLKDYSGYGEANRHAVAALHAAGVNVMAQLVRYTLEPADYGTIGHTINQLLQNKDDYQIKIIHTTPDQYHMHMEPGKYHIGHFFWETDKVSPEFAKGLELMDEIWTGSQANKDAIEKGGVSKPVIIIPQATETEREWPEKYKVPEIDKKDFVFYSIFEWTDRKNPEALLRAYYEEFQAGENVALLIKTYFGNFTLNNKKKIRHQINAIKAHMGLRNPAKVLLYLDLMDRNQIMRFHKTGDCFVSAHRGEGWGVPQVEAMLAGNPVISTNWGGVHEYLDETTAMLVPYKMAHLVGMEHSSKWYQPDQKWAEVDIKWLRDFMRNAYSDREATDKLALSGQSFVKERFNLERVGKEMKNRLEAIEDELSKTSGVKK